MQLLDDRRDGPFRMEIDQLVVVIDGGDIADARGLVEVEKQIQQLDERALVDMAVRRLASS